MSIRCVTLWLCDCVLSFAFFYPFFVSKWGKRRGKFRTIQGTALQCLILLLGFLPKVNFFLQTYKKWILKTIEETWTLFHDKFTALWHRHKDGSGEAYLPEIYNNPDLQQLIQEKYMKELFHDTLGFGAAKMIRWDGRFLFFIYIYLLS